MSCLVLVRHSLAKLQPGVSAHTWDLTDEGRQRCVLLADRLRPFQITRFFSSDEPKALSTVRLLAEHLHSTPQPVSTDSRLRETARHNVPYTSSLADFKRAIQTAMQRPTELRFGEETFSDALARFSTAIDAIAEQSPHQTVAVGTHGTIMSLYVAHRTGFDPFAFWELLAMPAFVALSLPDLKPIEICFSLQPRSV